MKKLIAALSVATILCLMACNNQPAKPVEEAPVTTTTPVDTPPQPLTPYKAMLVTFNVKDFDKWYAEYRSLDSLRSSFNLMWSTAGRGLDNDKWVIVLNDARELQSLKNLETSPERKEAMKTAGIVGTPAITYYEALRDDTISIPQKERMMVTHRVKDFDAWLKAYDAEGKEARAAHGIVDRWLARGIEDTNTVTLLFAITDMAKAKARVNSPELKKIMTDAGVEGKPVITYFKWVNIRQ